MTRVRRTPRHHPGRPRHVRAIGRIDPRRGVQSGADRDPHQLVVLRQILDLVDAVAVPIVRAEYRWVLVREATPQLRLVAVRTRAECAYVPFGRAGTLAMQTLQQRRESGDVATGERWHLVADVVRRHTEN